MSIRRPGGERRCGSARRGRAMGRVRAGRGAKTRRSDGGVTMVDGTRWRKRARRDDAVLEEADGDDDGDDDDDDDDDDDADDDDGDADDDDGDGVERDSRYASVAGAREIRASEGVREGVTAPDTGGETGERRRAPISIKAPPLLEEQISRLSEDEQRRVRGRWNARLRGLKKRVEDVSHQFPTSSLVLVFTKPFRTKDRLGKWYVVHDDFMVYVYAVR